MCWYVLPETCDLDLSISKTRQGLLQIDYVRSGMHHTSSEAWHLIGSCCPPSSHCSGHFWALIFGGWDRVKCDVEANQSRGFISYR